MFACVYPAIFRRDEIGRYVAGFPDFPHAHTDGKDVREATEEAIDCLGSVIAGLIGDGSDVRLGGAMVDQAGPQPGPPVGLGRGDQDTAVAGHGGGQGLIVRILCGVVR